jgi:hypothetical protein
MNPRMLAALLLAVLISGCEDTEESQFLVGLQGRTDVLRPLITVTASGPGWEVELEGPEIRSDGSDNYSRVFRTPGRGTLRVVARLQSADGEELALGSAELDLRRDWVWSMDIWLNEGDPTETCMGCMGVLAFQVPNDLLPEVADSLYLVWGGNSISDPVIY